MKTKTERRFTPFQDTELRVEPGESGQRIVGYVARFNRWSPIYYDFREQVAPGFFDDVLSQDVRGLFNHDSNWVLGRTTAGTMRLRADELGLLTDIDAPETDLIADLVLSPIRRRDVTGASFSFTVAEDRWDKNDEGLWERTLIRAAELFDVGPVTFPFYPDTDLAVRSLDAWRTHQPAEGPPADPANRLRQRRAELELVAD